MTDHTGKVDADFARELVTLFLALAGGSIFVPDSLAVEVGEHSWSLVKTEDTPGRGVRYSIVRV